MSSIELTLNVVGQPPKSIFETRDAKEVAAVSSRELQKAVERASGSNLPSSLHLEATCGSNSKEALPILGVMLQLDAPLTHLTLGCNSAHRKLDHVKEMMDFVNRDGRAIQKLDLHGMSQRGGVEALQCMRRNQSVTHLHVDLKYIGDNGTREVRKMLGCNPRIQHLQLSYSCRISSRGLRHICKGALKHPSLQSLDLEGNHFRSSDIQYIERLLLRNPNITSLGMAKCFLDCEDTPFCASLARILRQCTTLLKMDLSCIPLGDNGMRVVEEILSNHNKTLQELDFRQTGDVNTRGRTVTRILQKNTGLRKLILDIDYMDDIILVEMLDTLATSNTTLEEIEFHDFCGMINMFGEHFARMLTQNRTLTSIKCYSLSHLTDDTKDTIVESLSRNGSLTTFHLFYDQHHDPARFYTDRNRMRQFLKSDEISPQLWMHGLERASEATLSALFYYVRETSDFFKKYVE